MILDLHNYTTQSPNAFDWCMHDPFPIEEGDKADPETEKAANIPEETWLGLLTQPSWVDRMQQFSNHYASGEINKYNSQG